MLKELLHIFRTYFITFRYLKKFEILYFITLIVFIYLIK